MLPVASCESANTQYDWRVEKKEENNVRHSQIESCEKCVKTTYELNAWSVGGIAHNSAATKKNKKEINK